MIHVNDSPRQTLPQSYVFPFRCFLVHNLVQLAAPLLEGGGLSNDPNVWRLHLQARAWLVSADQEGPFSYSTCCEILQLPASRGRAWARGIIDQIEREKDATDFLMPFRPRFKPSAAREPASEKSEAADAWLSGIDFNLAELQPHA